MLVAVIFASKGWVYLVKRRHDTQYNDIQYNNIQYNNIQYNDTQHKGPIYDTRQIRHSAYMAVSIAKLYLYAMCHYNECRIFFVILSVIMLSVIKCCYDECRGA